MKVGFSRGSTKVPSLSIQDYVLKNHVAEADLIGT